RQFVLGPRPVLAGPGWQATEVPGIGYLSHCPELRVARARDAAGAEWHLLGVAVQTDSQLPSPAEQIAACDAQSIGRAYAGWAGRWALVGNRQLAMDAAGLLGCFYGTQGTGAARELWASSSPALAAELVGAGPAPLRSIKHRKGMDWYPG